MNALASTNTGKVQVPKEMCRNMIIFILLKSDFTLNIVHDVKIHRCVRLEYFAFTNLLLHQISKIEDDFDVVA